MAIKKLVKTVAKKAVDKTKIVPKTAKKKVVAKKVATVAPKKVAVKTKVKAKVATKIVYDESSIKTLEGVKAVQAKKGMYVGNGPTAVLQLPQEIISNSVDEAIGGYCTKIDVTIEKDGSMSITDNGRGIPVGKIKHKGKMIGAAEISCTSLHSGGKMDTKAYAVSAGTNGQQVI